MVYLNAKYVIATRRYEFFYIYAKSHWKYHTFEGYYICSFSKLRHKVHQKVCKCSPTFPLRNGIVTSQRVIHEPFVAARRIYCCLTFFAITLVLRSRLSWFCVERTNIDCWVCSDSYFLVLCCFFHRLLRLFVGFFIGLTFATHWCVKPASAATCCCRYASPVLNWIALCVVVRTSLDCVVMCGAVGPVSTRGATHAHTFWLRPRLTFSCDYRISTTAMSCFHRVWFWSFNTSFVLVLWRTGRFI